MKLYSHCNIHLLHDRAGVSASMVIFPGYYVMALHKISMMFTGLGLNGIAKMLQCVSSK